MSLDRLRWFTIVLPIVFMTVLQICLMLILEPQLGHASGHAVAIVVVAAAVVVFSTTIFRVLARMQQKIVRQNEELSALNAVGQAASGSLDLQTTITSALDTITEVTEASAAQIIVASDTLGEPPLTFARGAADGLKRLDAIPDLGATGEGVDASGGDVRIIDLRQRQGAAPAAAVEGGFPICARVPLRAQNQSFGVMRLLAGENSQLASEGSARLLAAMGNQMAIAIQANHLFQDVLRRGKEAQALYEIGLEITSLQDIQKILDTIVDQAREIVGSETAALCLVRDNDRRLRLSGCSGPRDAFPRAPSQVTPLPLTILPEQSAVLDPDAPCPALAAGYRIAHLSAPLRVGTAVIGELCVSSRTPQRFAERHRELLARLADMAAIAINNARLLEAERHMAVLEERERLALEMHDSLAQVLGYLHLKAQTTKRTIARGQVAKAEEELEEMATMAHEAYLDVREAILALREASSPAEGIVSALRDYLQKFGRQASIKVELEVAAGAPPQFSPEAEVQLVRVVQEALTNVRKHANAETVWVRIGRQNGDTSICIEDDGQGFDASGLQEDDRRFGVRTMKERVESVGGRFEIGSTPGEGTRVWIHIPIAEGDDDEPSENPSRGRPGPVQERPADLDRGAGGHGGRRRSV